MLALSVAFHILLLAVSCWFLWVSRCAVKTGRQRHHLIEAVSDAIKESNYESNYWPAYDSVTFDRHLWLLVTLRDPWREYVGLPPGFRVGGA